MMGLTSRHTVDTATTPRVHLLTVAVISLVTAMPIFAHGCHREDHDYEPLFKPVESRTMAQIVAEVESHDPPSAAE